MKIRTHLVILGLAVLIPMTVFAIIAVVALDRQQRAGVERGAVETARALSHAVDRELSGMLATLHTLATARSLERDDLAAFHADARRVLASRPEWNTILLIAPTGQLVDGHVLSVWDRPSASRRRTAHCGSHPIRAD
jgi:CHASE1-domain containing sensor protein